MKTIVCLALLAVCVAAKLEFVADQAFVDQINAAKPGWTASMTSPTAGLTREEAKRMLPLDISNLASLPTKTFPEAMATPPAEFDSHTYWPNCQSMTQIRDQSDCGSCWAFGAAEAMSDRECIINGRDIVLSAEDINSCSHNGIVDCGSCNGGQPACAWEYFMKTGVVTEACAPYSLPGCDHHIANSSNPCPSTYEYSTPACPSTCTAQGQTWTKYKSSTAYQVSGEKNIMNEIMTNGPCETAFSVYDDFLTYTSGVYKHVSGKYDGGHAVKILGWGVDEPTGEKYWYVANSWNAHWGMSGYFKILKGVDECGIENACYAGVPKKVSS